jgi:hypothetical protein
MTNLMILICIMNVSIFYIILVKVQIDWLLKNQELHSFVDWGSMYQNKCVKANTKMKQKLNVDSR